jgi:hypothetical protein
MLAAPAIVTGPRIDPDTLPHHEDLELRGYVPELYRHLAVCDLAVCDLAIVPGGLTTCMELTATRRPFLYFPLRHHFEQKFHVRIDSTGTAPDSPWTSSSRHPKRLPR